MSIMKKLESARSQLMKSLNEIPIKWGRYINQDMQEEKVIFFGHEKAIYGSDGEMLDEKLVKIKGDISDEFSEEKSYEINNYCIYQNRLYRFTSPHTGPFDGTHVIPVSISQELVEVQRGLEGVEGRLYPNNIGGNDIYAYAQGLSVGFYPISTSSNTVNGPGVGCTGYIEKRNSSTIVIVLTSPSNGITYTNSYSNVWHGWEQLIANSDLAVSNYSVPKPANTGVITLMDHWNIWAIKYGRVVMLRFNVQGYMSASNSDELLTTIPNEYAPMADLIINYINQSGNALVLSINHANGEIRINNLNKATAGTWLIRQCITYISAS